MKKTYPTGILVLIVATITSCNPSRKIDKWIGRHYEQAIPKIKSNDFIAFNTGERSTGAPISETHKTKSRVVPAFFYWQFQYETTSKLNAALPMNNFATGFLAEVDKKGLRDRLSGAKLSISITDNPADFNYHDDEWMVYFIIGYFGKTKVYVEPKSPLFIVHYAVTSPTGQSQTGSVEVSNLNMPKSPRFFQSLKGAIGEYLIMSDANMKIMARDVADKMIVDLQAGGVVK